MIDRYKKKGGFIQLLQLIETASPKKQEQFFKIIAEESPLWETAIRQKALTIERVFKWPEETLIEICTRLPHLTLAAALHGSPQSLVQQVLETLPPITRRRFEDTLQVISPSPGERHSAILRFISDLRGLIQMGVIKLEKIDPDLLIPDNFEEALNNQPWSPPKNLKQIPKPEEPAAEASTNPSPPADPKSPITEIDFLKRKVNQLVSEVNVLRNENNTLKDKLDQIKRIA